MVELRFDEAQELAEKEMLTATDINKPKLKGILKAIHIGKSIKQLNANAFNSNMSEAEKAINAFFILENISKLAYI